MKLKFVKNKSLKYIWEVKIYRLWWYMPTLRFVDTVDENPSIDNLLELYKEKYLIPPIYAEIKDKQ